MAWTQRRILSRTPNEIRSHDSLGVDLDAGGFPPSPWSLAEDIHVRLPGEQESQVADAPVAAGLVEAEQHEIVHQPGLPQAPGLVLPVVGELSDGVLGQVIVPAHPVVANEGEELVPVLEQAPPKGFRGLGTERLVRYSLEVLVHV